jgi:hypothetical protein
VLSTSPHPDGCGFGGPKIPKRFRYSLKTFIDPGLPVSSSETSTRITSPIHTSWVHFTGLSFALRVVSGLAPSRLRQISLAVLCSLLHLERPSSRKASYRYRLAACGADYPLFSCQELRSICSPDPFPCRPMLRSLA